MDPALAPRHEGARARAAAVAVACLLGGALSLLATPDGLTYDPQSWLVWAREIVHGDLSTTTGPSWKPLPMVLLVPFALLGDVAPQLWLVVTRAAALGTLWLAFRLATRLGGSPVAGAVAAGAMALTPWTVRNAWLGNSESLVVLSLLGAVLDHLDGRHRRAFGWGVALALLRPEVWPWVGLQGLWLIRRDRSALRLALPAGVLVVAAWTLPELIGSGDALRALTRAQETTEGTAGATGNPAAAVLRLAVDELPRVAWVGLALLLLGLPAWRRLRERATFALAALGVGWMLVVVAMTARGGFSGSDRYLIVPMAVACVLGGVGVGWLVRRLPVPSAAVPALTVAAGAVALVPALGGQPGLWRDVVQQGRLSTQLAAFVDASGGPGRLRTCGPPTTTALMVPQVAWELRTRLRDVTTMGRPDALVLAARITPGGELDPPTWPRELQGGRVLGESSAWWVVGRCPPAPVAAG